MFEVHDTNDFNVDTGITAVKFWATWCSPCKLMSTTIVKLEKEFKLINFLSIDVDQVPELAKRYCIKTVPTLVVLRNGDEINRIAGMSLIDPLRRIFREVIDKKQYALNSDIL